MRGNTVWHVNAINSRMQVPEIYEAVNNSNTLGTMLFVSCPFPSIQAGNAYFTARVGPFIQGAQTLPAFFNGLQKEGYNAVNPSYYSQLAGRINSIPKWEAACKVN